MATILVVEDDETFAKSLTLELERRGHTVVTASDGEAALNALRTGQPDLLLLDILLPKRSGFDILEELTRDPALAHPPVVVLSSSGKPLEKQRAAELGAAAYLIKSEQTPDALIQQAMSFMQQETVPSAGGEAPAPAAAGASVASPAAVPGPAAVPVPATAAAPQAAGGRSVLVVEDDKFLRDLITQKLKREGFTVFEAVTGSEAMRVAEENQPKIILLDLILPGLDGFEVLKRLKEKQLTAPIPVIILSNLGQREDVERGLRLGAVDFMIKAHFTPGEIVEKIKEILSKASPA
jgi:DNA-binding response OmpR family regulator